MFAVVEIAGKQFIVSENEKHYVPLLSAEVDSEVTFDKVLLLSDDAGTKVGAPYVDGLKVSGKVLEHVQDDKILVFKKKRRTGYKKSYGHRTDLTRVEITKIG